MTNINIFICTSAVLMTTKLGRVGTFGGWTKLQSHVNFPFRGHVANEENVYLHLHNAMATKLDKVVTYIKRIPPTNSRNLLITWSRET